MIDSKIVLIAVLAVGCFIAQTSAIKCFSCVDANDCKKPIKLECTPFLANQTTRYLDIHRQGVPLNATSPFYNCYAETINSGVGRLVYNGCIYQNLMGCSYNLRPFHSTGSYNVTCNQCARDLCNSASNGQLSGIVGLVSVAVALLWSKVGSVL